jgi:hypothetical protein
MTPAEAYVRSFGEGHYLLSEVAEKVGVAPQTLRRLIKDPDRKIHAPSYLGHVGKMEIYVFTDADIVEIAAHYKARYEGFELRDLERGPGRPKSKKVK